MTVMLHPKEIIKKEKKQKKQIETLDLEKCITRIKNSNLLG